jgi:dTMP kinase
MPHNRKGVLITFCGLDGCGKTTMINMLQDYFKYYGINVALTKQPTDNMRQSHIFRTYMDAEDHSAYSYRSLSLMAAADRIQHCNHVVLPVLHQGTVLISDRYIYSCLANLRARGYKSDRWIYEIVKDIPKPDLAFFLDVPVEVAVERVRQRPEEKNRYIDMDLQYKLREEYINICAENGGILIPSIDEPSVTFDRIWNCVYDKLGERYED